MQRALEVFWERGYAATSLQQIGAATRMNRPSLYGAFGNKKSIYLKALARFVGEMSRALEEMMRPGSPVAQALFRFYSAAIEIYTGDSPQQRGCLLICTAAAEAVHDGEIRAMLGRTLEQIDRALTLRFKIAQRSGELPPGVNANQRGRMAAAVLHSLAVRARAGQSPRMLKRFARSATELMIA
jgi:AcrR family transcriptional regulator